MIQPTSSSDPLAVVVFSLFSAIVFCLVPATFWIINGGSVTNLWRYRRARLASRSHLRELLVQMPLDPGELGEYLIKHNPFKPLNDYDLDRLWKREVERVITLQMSGKLQHLLERR